jgi:hypothetical protein
MQITIDLKLVFPIRWADEPDKDGNLVPTVYAYHTPISQAVFEANFRLIAATAAQLGRFASIATLELREVAKEAGSTENALALLESIKQSTLVMIPDANGTYKDFPPVDNAIARGAISAEDWSEAEATLVFFTCRYSLTPRMNRPALIRELASALKGLTTSSVPTELAASLPTLTPGATSAAKAVSSVPS